MPANAELRLERAAVLLFGSLDLPVRFGPFATHTFMPLTRRPPFTYATLLDPGSSPPLTTLYPVIQSAMHQAMRLRYQLNRPMSSLTGDLEYMMIPEYRNLKPHSRNRFTVQVVFRVYLLQEAFDRFSASERCNELATVLACPWFASDAYHRAQCFSSHNGWYQWPMSEADMYGALQVRSVTDWQSPVKVPAHMAEHQHDRYRDLAAVDDESNSVSGLDVLSAVTSTSHLTACGLRCLPAVVVGPVPKWNGAFMAEPAGYGKRVILLSLVGERRSRGKVTLVVCTDKADLTQWVDCATQNVPNSLAVSVGMPATDINDYDVVCVAYSDVVASYPAEAIHSTKWDRVFFSHSEELQQTDREVACTALDARLRVAVSNRPLRHGYTGLALQLRVLMGGETIDIMQPILEHLALAPYSLGVFQRPAMQEMYTVGTLSQLLSSRGYPIGKTPPTVELIPVKADDEWYDDHSWLTTVLRLRQEKAAGMATSRGYERYIERTAVHRDLLMELCATGQLTKRMPLFTIPGRRKPIPDDIEVQMDLDDSAECSICLGPLRVPVVTPCRHVFCQDCLGRVKALTKGGPTACPQCRSAFTRPQVQLVKASTVGPRAKRSKQDVSHNRTGKVGAAGHDIADILAADPAAKVLVLASNPFLLAAVHDYVGVLVPGASRLLWKSGVGPIPETVAAHQVVFVRHGDRARNFNQAGTVVMLDIPVDGMETRAAISSVVRYGQAATVAVRAYVVADSEEHAVAKKGIVRPGVQGFRAAWSRWAGVLSTGSKFWDQ
jgi:hypothetical protein